MNKSGSMQPIEQYINLRNQKVILDSDIAKINLSTKQ